MAASGLCNTWHSFYHRCGPCSPVLFCKTPGQKEIHNFRYLKGFLTFRTLFGLKFSILMEGGLRKCSCFYNYFTPGCCSSLGVRTFEHFLQGKVDLHSQSIVLAPWSTLSSWWFLSPLSANGATSLPSSFSRFWPVLMLALAGTTNQECRIRAGSTHGASAQDVILIFESPELLSPDI